ncbi:MAG: hypothetical protein JO258_03210, partial [Alphaproteobacteria bacterium]|nr:hypothetical protein [Alphaproteobacteria bacterium]
AEDLRDLSSRLKTLRDRNGDETRGHAAIPAPRDIYIPDFVIQSRDFR